MIVEACMGLGVVGYFRGAWEEAHQILERAQAISRQQASTSWVAPYPLFVLSWLYQAEGQREQAASYAHQAFRLAEPVGDVVALRMTYLTLPEQDLMDGHPQPALERLLSLLEQREQESSFLLLAPLLAWAHLDTGARDQADQVIAETIAVTRSNQNRLVLVDALRVQALLLIEQERWEEAAAALKEALTLARAMPYPYAEVKVLYVYGLLHQQRGEPELARECWQTALTICQRLGERLYAQHIEQVLAHLEPEQ
jgi:tetratricopeptide (TPR) repeat protein